MMTGQQLAKARDRERGRDREKLPREQYEEFKVILGALTLDRASIKKAMGFALDHSEYAVDIVQVLYKSFQQEEAPSNADLAGGNTVPADSAVHKVAYFFVASDILHNSSAAVKNASLFRTTFQEFLPSIMDILRSCHRRIVGRMSANAMKEKVLNVLTAWESWSLFPPMFLVGLNATFLRKVDEDEPTSCVRDESVVLNESEEEAIRKRCKQSGILASGSSMQMLARLRWLKEYTAPQKCPASVPQQNASSLDAKSLVDQVKRDLDALRKDATLEMAIRSKNARDTQEDDDDDDLDGEPLDEQQPIGEHGEGDSDDEDLDGEPLDSDNEE